MDESYDARGSRFTCLDAGAKPIVNDGALRLRDSTAGGDSVDFKAVVFEAFALALCCFAGDACFARSFSSSAARSRWASLRAAKASSSCAWSGVGAGSGMNSGSAAGLGCDLVNMPIAFGWPIEYAFGERQNDDAESAA